MKTLAVSRNIIASMFAVILMMYGVSSISYGQGDAPTVTPGEINTTLKVSFTKDDLYTFDKIAYEFQLRRKSPQGEWMTKCIDFLFTGDSLRTYVVFLYFTNLEPGVTYEARYRDTNLPECAENPPSPDSWSIIGEGTTPLAVPRVEFVDATLAKFVRRALNLDTEGEHIELLKIPTAQLQKLTTLVVKTEGFLSDLTGLEHASHLTRLVLSWNGFSNITPLAELTQLTTLDLEGNDIVNIASLGQLAQLTTLHLGSNRIVDIGPLAQLTLTELWLQNNNIRDITLPEYFGTELNLSRNRIRDVTPLAQLADSSVIRLELSDNNISDITPLAQLADSSVALLDLSDNQIRDVTPLAQLANSSVTSLNLSDNQIRDVTPLTALTQLRRLSLSRNPIETTYPLRALLDANPGVDIDIAIITEEEPALSVSTHQPLTGATLDGAIVTLKLTNGAFHINTVLIRDALAISGIPGIGIGNSSEIERISQAQIEVKLTFEGSKITADSTLIITVGPDAIPGYIGPARTVELPVSASTDPEIPISDATLRIRPSPVPSPAIGEQLTFSLNIADGENVAAYQATVQFDDSALRYVSSAIGDYLPAGAILLPVDASENMVTFAAVSFAGESNGDGTLATITFEVIEVKESTLTLTDVLLSDSAETASRPRVEDAQIVESPQIGEDVNGDGVVNILDLVRVASSFGTSGENGADVNGDGIVNILDLVRVAGALGNAAAAPSVNPGALDVLTAADVGQWLAHVQELNLTDATSQRGVLFLEQLLAALTPEETTLLPNYPNPFNPETWIPYQLATSAAVTVTIYDMNGDAVRRLEVGHQAAGTYQSRGRAAYWDGRNVRGESVASGLYFYTLKAGEFTGTRKMLIRK